MRSAPCGCCKPDDGGPGRPARGGGARRAVGPARLAGAAPRRRLGSRRRPRAGGACAASSRLLDRVAVVADLAAARSLVADHPSVRAVTRDGDVLGARWSAGGSASAPSSIEIRAAVDEAQLKADEAAARHERLHAQLASPARRATRTGRLQARSRPRWPRCTTPTPGWPPSPSSSPNSGQAARSASAEAARLDAARAAAEEARDRDLSGLAELEERRRLAESQTGEPAEPVADERDSLQAELAAARQAEMEARLALRTAEERARAVAGRADQLLRAAELERAARRRPPRRRARRAAAERSSPPRSATPPRCSRHRAIASRPRPPNATPAQQARVGREGELLAAAGPHPRAGRARPG